MGTDLKVVDFILSSPHLASYIKFAVTPSSPYSQYTMALIPF